MNGLLLAALLAQAPMPQPTKPYAQCYGMVPDGVRITSLAITDFAAVMARHDELRAALPAGTQAVCCRRASIVPQGDDWRILAAGLPLYIASSVSDQVGALEIITGRLQFRMTQGDLDAAQAQAIQQSVNELQLHANVQPRPGGTGDR